VVAPRVRATCWIQSQIDSAMHCSSAHCGFSVPGLLVALTIFVGFVQEYARARAGAARD
jgi:hypothetical protein